MRDEIKLILKNKNKNGIFSEYVTQQETNRSSSIDKNNDINISRLINTFEEYPRNNISITENNETSSIYKS